MVKATKSQIVTKKHLARQERERRQTRLIVITSIAVIVIVVGLIAFGAVQQYLIQPKQPVAKVANDVITTKQFQTFALYERLQLIQQYQQYQQFAQLFGNDQASMNYIQQYLAQINYQLQPIVLGQSALDFLIADRFIQREAETRGINVTSEEVEKALQAYFGYYAEGTPTSAPTSAAIPTSTLNPTQISLLPPTSTAIPTATITTTQVITVTQEAATPTPAAVITPTATAPTSTPLPTATPYTLSAYQEDLKGYMSDIKTFVGLSENDFQWIFGMQLLRQKVFEAVTADIPREQEQVWARQIVIGDEADAQAVYDRLAAGEDFIAVATEVYSDTGAASTADLGWFGLGTQDINVDQVIFNLQIGQISEPIETANGWEIYQVLGHEVRTLTDPQYDELKQTEFQNWLDEQTISEEVQTFEIWKTRVPLKPTIPPTQAST